MKNIITHICFPEGSKIDDFDQCFYYIKHPDKDEYSFGTDNNYFTKEQINNFVQKGKLIELKQPIILNETQTLWHKSFESLFVADMYNPKKNQKLIGKITKLVK